MTTPRQLQLLSSAPSCSMRELLEEVTHLTAFDPEILSLIENNQDTAAIAKKRERVADAEWEHSMELFELMQDGTCDSDKIDKGKVALAPRIMGGRPRTPAEIVLAGFFIRGKYGSLTASGVRDRLVDSATFQELLWRHGMVQLEATVLARHVNNLSDGTVKRIQDSQINMYGLEGLDDFRVFTADSTSVRANAQWPNDSSLIFKQLRLATSVLLNFEKNGWCDVRQACIGRWLEQIRLLARDIDLSCGKSGAPKKRKHLYRKLLKTARKLTIKLGLEWARVSDSVMAQEIRPSHARLRKEGADAMKNAITDAQHLIDFAELRTQWDPKVKRLEHEKITGVVEPDAVLIKKGGREPNFGFKPQMANSGNGFITAMIVEKGNTSDSESFIPLLDEAIARTGVVPTIATVDDGYSSQLNWKRAHETRHVKVVSISGSKGRAVIGEELYESDAYKDARRIRGKGEFPFFILKHIHEMDRMKRTGISSVRREILEKALAFNAMRAVQLRKQHAKAAAINASANAA